MMSMISEFCPIQFDGDIYGYPAYFRARHDFATLVISKKGIEPLGARNDDVVMSFGEDCDSYCIDECACLLLSWIEKFRVSSEIVYDQKENVLILE